MPAYVRVGGDFITSTCNCLVLSSFCVLHAVCCSSSLVELSSCDRDFRAGEIMAQRGDVCSSKGKFFAKIDAQERGARFYMTGPRRDDEHQAGQDLKYIRAAASGEASRLGELRAMVTGTKPLRGNIAFSKTGPLLPKANRAQGSLHVHGARLAVQRVLCTSSQLARTCNECFARSSFREIQSIDILVPKI